MEEVSAHRSGGSYGRSGGCNHAIIMRGPFHSLAPLCSTARDRLERRARGRGPGKWLGRKRVGTTHYRPTSIRCRLISSARLCRACPSALPTCTSPTRRARAKQCTQGM
eukprot:5358670-Prymnesium_polylepis.1